MMWTFSRFRFTILLCIVSACQFVSATEAGLEPASAETNVIEVVTQESFIQLKAENDALRRENQILRRELVAKKGVLLDGLLPQKVVEPEAKPKAQDEDTGYWLSEKSKIRHNSRCRSYRQVKGRSCGPQDGRACKVCGG